jgi:predicted methyltransferase
MLKNILTLISASLLFTTVTASDSDSRLNEVLGAQAENVQSRYVSRRPAETLEFFGLEPGMTVMEGLPGGGWYSKILLPYLGDEGQLIGADYAQSMFPLFGFFKEEDLKAKETWVEDWTEKANGWRSENDAPVTAFVLGSMPDDMTGTADAVLMIRAFGGVMGIVQHEARPDMPDDWADGSRGYLKESFVIAAMEKAGFVLEASSDMNNNPADVPTEEDIVWRLPPSLATSRKDNELKAKLQAVGESNRMTLRFRKPVNPVNGI